jgi:hypothetical protein
MTPSSKAVVSCALACVVSLPFAAHADTIYKWVDEKGVTHFSQTPPETNTKADKVDVRVPQAAAHAEAPAAGEPKKPQMSEAKREKREERCKAARESLERLNNPAPVVTIDEKTGEKTAVPDVERAKHIAQVKKVIGQQCDDAAPAASAQR